MRWQAVLYKSLIALTLLAFTGCLVMTIYAPLYTDDILSGISAYRAGYDHWHAITIYPLCGEGFSTPIPLLLLPGHVFSWLFYTQITSFYAIHVQALLVFLGFAATGIFFLRRESTLSWLETAGLFAAVSGVGVMPFMLTQGRPETGIVWALLIYSVSPLLPRAWFTRLPERIALVIVFFMTSSWLYSMHYKGLLYAPFILASCAFLPLPKSWRAATAVLVAAIMAQTYVSMIPRLACPGEPAAANFMRAQALSIGDLLDDPSMFLHLFFINLYEGYHYFAHMLLMADRWLPPFSPGWWVAPGNAVIIALILALPLWLLSGITSLRHWRSPRVILAVLLLAGMTAQGGIQFKKAFYDTSMFWFGILLAGFLLNERRYTKPAIAAVLFFSLLSQFAFIHSYAPAMINKSDAHIQFVGHNGPGPSKRYVRLLQSVTESAAQCGIAMDETSKHVVVDTGTYMPLRETFEPFWVSAAQWHDYPPNWMLNIFRKRGSSGIIVSCKIVPQSLQDKMQHTGGTCCMKFGDQ